MFKILPILYQTPLMPLNVLLLLLSLFLSKLIQVTLIPACPFQVSVLVVTLP
jgi:hypothetical protein